MPVRRIPRFGAQKNIGKFTSIKTGRVAWYESLLERDYMYLLDFDPHVTFWAEQPLRIRFSYKGKAHSYTPDLEIHRGSKKQIVEVKSKHQVDSGKWDLLFRISTSVCKQDGYEYVVVTDEVIRAEPKLTSVKKLWKYSRTPISPQHQLLCREFFRATDLQPAELIELIDFFKSKRVPAQVVYALIFWGVLEFDLMQPLNESAVIKMSSVQISANRRRAS
jgi:hypothetical protein